MLFEIMCQSNEYYTFPYTWDNLNCVLRGPRFIRDPNIQRPDYNKLVIEIVLGFSCNNNCEYCNHKKHTINWKNKKYDKKYIKKFCDYIINYIKLSNVANVSACFWGGEALLYFNYIKEIYSRLSPFIPHFSIATNGKLLKDKVFDWILQNDIHVVISHDGEYNNKLRTYDILTDDIVFNNIKKLIERNRFTISPVVTKYTSSRRKVVEYLENKFESQLLFGDFKFLFPISENIYDEMCVPENELSSWSNQEYKDILEYTHTKNYISIIEQTIYTKFNKPFTPLYPRTFMASKNLTVHLNGALTYVHSNGLDSKFIGGESCVYGNLFDENTWEHTYPKYVQYQYNTRCVNCPIVAFGDRGCHFFSKIPGYEEYYCKTQLARLVPIFGKVFNDLTGNYFVGIYPKKE